MSSAEPDLRVVLAEPDDAIAEDLLAAAERHRHVTILRCRNGAEALVAVGADKPDMLLIAAQMPTLATKDVIEIGRRHRQVCVVVGAGHEDGGFVNEALAAGAFAIVARPYPLDAVLTIAGGLRASGRGLPWPEPDRLVSGALTVDLRAHVVLLGDVEVPLTSREFDVLVYLLRRRGDVASREEISSSVWGHAVDTNTVAVHIKRLRDKLGHHSHGPTIRTIRGAGYRLAPADHSGPCQRPVDAAV
jgi:DNA-binding response OmpR family regulator